MACVWCWICPTQYLALNAIYWYILAATVSWAIARFRRPGFAVKGKHVLVTGGSEGLGLSVATKLARKGAATVTLLSRTQSKLDKAKAALLAAVPNVKVLTVSADVSNYEAVSAAVKKAEQQGGPISVLVGCAGLATPGYFLEQDVSVFHKMMDVNYFGLVHVVKAVAPGMASRREGTIVLTGSANSLLSYIGYSQYCSSKWAMRALADSLRQEFTSYGLRVHAFYPSNMKTAGFAQEELTKPIETKKIEDGGMSSTPDESAQRLIDGVAAGNYIITEEFIVWLLQLAGSPLTPRNLLVELPFAVLALVVGWGVGIYFDSFVDKSKRWPHDKKD